MISMLSPYAADLYPTKLRASGGGVSASSSKAGGIIGPFAMARVMTLFPGLTVPALSVVVPLLLAAGVLFFNGIETSGKRLEELQETVDPTLLGQPKKCA
jgi:putative MFS transporter